MFKKKVLIVEDTEIGRYLLDVIFDKDVNVFFAFDGEEALNLVFSHKGQFDLILLDLLMPKIDGYSVLKTLKAHPEYSKIPVVVVTSVEHGGDAVLADYDIEDVIYKPFNTFLVKKRIDNILKSKAYEDAQIASFKQPDPTMELTPKGNEGLLFDSESLPKEYQDLANAGTLFDYYRIVDPKNHEVYSLEKGKLVISGHLCYEVWDRTSPCFSCISKAACSFHKPYFKIEHFGNTTYWMPRFLVLSKRNVSPSNS